MKYRVIATLGPASATPELWKGLLAAGANTFRLNTSHLTVDAVERWITALDAALGERRPEVVLDLQGSKWRLGEIEPTTLAAGTRVVLQYGETLPDAADTAREGRAADRAVVLPVPHDDFFSAAFDADGVVRLNDNRVELVIEARTESVAGSGSAYAGGDASPDAPPDATTKTLSGPQSRAAPKEIYCRVVRGGPVSSRKGISLPGSQYRREGLLPKDAEIISRTVGMHRISYALSYVRDAQETAALRRAITEASMEKAKFEAKARTTDRRPAASPSTIAKIERPEAVDAAVEIAQESDAVWLCRGDLGAEVGGPETARRVHAFTARLGELSCEAILAGQVLEHMTHNAEPTRSEICHLYDILVAGFAGVVLSDETAVGSYPIESCAAAASFQ